MGAYVWSTRFIEDIEQSFSIRVEDEGLAPEIPQGTVIGVDSSRRSRVTDGELVLCWYQGRSIARFYRHMAENRCILEPTNPAYQAILAPIEDVEIVGVVFAYEKKAPRWGEI